MLVFKATNNEAKYKALIVGLRIAEEMGVRNLQANVDSRLVANQVNGTYTAKEADMIRYLEKGQLQLNYVLRRNTDGSCSMHARHKIVVAKALANLIILAYFAHDAMASDMGMPRLSSSRPFPRNSLQMLTPITSTMAPFYKWGIRPLLGHFRKTLAKWVSRKAMKLRRWIQQGSGRRQQEFGWKNLSSVILAEIGMPTLRTAEVDMVQNDEALEINLDHLEERREQAAIRDPKGKAKMEKYYNSKVRSTSFKPGDLVYRSNDASRAEEVRKLGPKREGPYEVTEVLGKGATSLR
ncbi:reverse transcriptase domain-containing protein [Tanacetum coccineum]